FVATISLPALGIIAAFIAVALFIRLRFSRALYEWQVRRTQLERRAGYLDWLITAQVFAKELRINQLGGHFGEQYSALRWTIRSERMALTRRRTVYETIVGVLGTVAFAGALLYIANQALAGHHSIGDLVIYVIIFQRAQSMGQEMIHEIARFYEDS